MIIQTLTNYTRNLLFYIANKKGLLKSALIIKCFRVVFGLITIETHQRF